jgi:histidine triad (HIT) family protein
LEIVIDLLYRFSRTHPGGAILAWLFKNMNFALPLERLRETDRLLAFYHPKPAYPFHVILVPKRRVESIETLTAEDQGFLSDLFRTVQDLVSEFRLAQNGYRLIVNGGKYQEFGLLHFHLISEERPEHN